ncbi:MAG: hypothetical protein ACLP53_22070 [Isosphaeraceae bacterium]
MVKKRAPKVKTATPPRPPVEVKTEMPVRLVLPIAIYHRLERQAELLGLTLASYARMKVIQGIAADEEGGSK